MPVSQLFILLLLSGGCVLLNTAVIMICKCYVAHECITHENVSDEKAKWISKMMSTDKLRFSNKHIDN